MFVFDTDHIGIIQWQSEPAYSRLLARVSNYAASDFFVTIVSLHEEFLGWNAYIAKAKKIDGVIKAYEKFKQILDDFETSQVLPFDTAAANQFVHLQRQKLQIGTMDLRIAAIALSRSMTLLTRNLQDFMRVPSLKLDDWTV